MRLVVTDDKSKESKIFFKSNGAFYYKGIIGRRISVFIVKSGIRCDKLIFVIDFRKWIVTELKRKKRFGLLIDEDLLRRLMCYFDKIVKYWYFRESLTEEVVEVLE